MPHQYQEMNQTKSIATLDLLNSLRNDKSITNLYITGHSLGGYLTLRATAEARQKNFEAYMAALEQADTLYDYRGTITETLLRYHKPDITNVEITNIYSDFKNFYNIFSFQEQLNLMTELKKRQIIILYRR